MLLKKGIWLLVILCISTVMISGCSKVNKENYEKISMGMDYKEVVAILGNPDSSEDILTGKSCTWGNETKNINIKFVANKTVLYKGKGL